MAGRAAALLPAQPVVEAPRPAQAAPPLETLRRPVTPLGAAAEVGARMRDRRQWVTREMARPTLGGALG
eukprot:2023566-Pyramimonas_sp.AAC.1